MAGARWQRLSGWLEIASAAPAPFACMMLGGTSVPTSLSSIRAKQAKIAKAATSQRSPQAWTPFLLQRI